MHFYCVFMPFRRLLGRETHPRGDPMPWRRLPGDRQLRLRDRGHDPRGREPFD